MILYISNYQLMVNENYISMKWKRFLLLGIFIFSIWIKLSSVILSVNYKEIEIFIENFVLNYNRLLY